MRRRDMMDAILDKLIVHILHLLWLLGLKIKMQHEIGKGS
jgi:hypothetical protein